MQVLHVAAELYPWVKTGGLGDVLAALPPALRAQGVDARLMLPRYAALRDGLAGQRPVAELPGGPGGIAAAIWAAVLPDTAVPIYLVDAPGFYDWPGNPYLGPDGYEWPDGHLRFGLLGWAAAVMGRDGIDGWRPEVVHGHDWHAGLAPAYLAAMGRPVASVFTIHNLAFQGWYPGDRFGALGLPASFFSIDGLEFYGQVSFMKSGLQFADRITTVSPTYAQEIMTPEHGAALDGVLRERSADLSGILNGVDYTIWSPQTDPNLPRPFDAADMAGKALAKAALQRHMGLDPAPDRLLFGAVTRLTRQKGFDLVLAELPAFVGDGAQFAMLGSGDRDLEEGFLAAASANPGQIAVRIGFDEGLAHRIVGGADSIVMPSRFEPCGLTQLYALRYGTLPLVNRTGGLADTVVDADDAALRDGSATGLVFAPAESTSFGAALRRATRLYRDRAAWASVQHSAIERRFGWAEAAARYIALYDSVQR